MRIEVYRRIDYAALALLALTVFSAFLILLWSTDLGVGTTPDSITYIDTARNIIAGKGFQSDGEPLTHYPPVYPALLAISGLFGIEPLDGARWLHSLIFALNVLILGTITYLSTNRSVTAGLCSILLFISSAQILEIHTTAWSEPPFIFFSLLALLLLALHIDRPSIPLLLGSSLFLGLALMTRYIGLTLLPPMIMAILLFSGKPTRARIKNSLVLLATGVSPLAIWLLRNILVGGTATDRTIVFHPINGEHIKSLFNTMYNSWMPIRHQGGLILFLIVSGLALIGFLLVIRDEMPNKGKASLNTIILMVMLLFSITYVAFLFASISLIDAHTPVDDRILSPVYVSGVIFLVSLSWRISSMTNIRGIWWGYLAISAILIYANANHALSSLIRLHNEGSGFTSRTWLRSESMAYVKSLPGGTIIYSNGPDIIHFLTGKEAMFIPARVSPVTLLANRNFSPELVAMWDDMAQNQAILVYFDNVTWRWYLPKREELEQYDIPVLFRFVDGTVYGVRKR